MAARVLLVDDHPDTLQLFRTYLTLAGFDVTAVTSAADALRIAHAGFDAVATDLAMPGMDGVEFIRRLRASGMDRIPVVAITGQAVDANTTTREHVDCCRLMIKPCNLDQLGDLLRALITACGGRCDDCPHRLDHIVVT